MALDFTRPGSGNSGPGGSNPGPGGSNPGNPGSVGGQPAFDPSKLDFTRPGRRAPGTSGTTPPAPPAGSPPNFPPSPPPVSPSAPPPMSPPISLNKISLTKDAPSVSLTKAGQAQGVLRVNLNWTAKPAKSGFMNKLTGVGAIDLDLGCLYELADGSSGGIQAVGRNFGNLNAHPYIQLDGDDRTGAVAGGENLLINLADPSRFKRILIFAMIYQGVSRWTQANGVVTLYPTAGPEIEVRLDAGDTPATICAIALLENRGGQLVVNREVRYVEGSLRNVDAAYGWGLNWTTGTK